LLKVIGAVIV